MSGVRRWRVSYKDGVTMDTGEMSFRSDISAPMVLATDYDQLLAERDAFKEVADEAVAEMVELRATTAKLRERNEALLVALRTLAGDCSGTYMEGSESLEIARSLVEKHS